MKGVVQVLTVVLCLGASAPGLAEPPSVRRLRFSSVGTELTLQSRSERLQMVLGPSEPIPNTREPRSGDWFELQDAGGKTLYLHLIHDMLGRYLEAPAADGKHHTTTVKKVPQSTFELLVPELAGAKSIVLFATTDDTNVAKEVGRFELPPSSAK